MLTRLTTISIALAISVAPRLSGQSGGSLFSYYNLGTPEAGSVGEASGRGGVEVPIRSAEGLNFGNPAGWTGLQYVSIQAGMTFEQFATGNGSETTHHNRTALDHIAAGFPLSDSLPLVIGLGVRPYRTTSYVTGGTLDIPSGDSTVSGRVIYSGSGGISQGFIGLAVEPIDRIRIGAQGELYFGNIERVSRLDFSTVGFNNAGYVRTTAYSGFGLTTGIQVVPIDGLTLGATWSLPVDLDAEAAEVGLYRTSSRDDTASATYDTTSIEVPAVLRAGLAYQTGRTILSGEVLMQDWTGTVIVGETARARGRYALGVDYLPDDRPGADGIERWGIRAGAYYDVTSVEIEGEAVTGMGGSIGVSIPFAPTGILGSGAALDLGIEIGSTTHQGREDLSELSGRLTAGVRINEFWFR